MPLTWCDYLCVGKQITTLTVKYFQNFTCKQDKNYFFIPFSLHSVGDVDHNQCFLESLLLTWLLSLQGLRSVDAPLPAIPPCHLYAT